MVDRTVAVDDQCEISEISSSILEDNRFLLVWFAGCSSGAAGRANVGLCPAISWYSVGTAISGDWHVAPVRAAGRNALLIPFLISALILLACVYRTYPFFFTFLTYLQPYLSFPLRIDPLRFQTGCPKKATKPGFSVLCLFCVVVHFFWLVNACSCCVRFSFFHTKPRDWLG